MFATLLTAIILLTSAPATAASPRSPVTALKIPSVHTAFPSNLHERLARQTILGDGYGGEGYMVEPILTEEEPATVILIHGMGGTGEEWGFVSLALSFFSLNYVKFIIPTAPTRFVSYLNETIPSWYDISKIANFATTVSRPELFESVDRVDNIIRGEIAAGVKQNRIFVIGFSQGGGLALTTFLRSSFNLAGCIGVATWLPLDSDYPDNLSPTVSNKQILLMHGTEDTAVPISLAVRTQRQINAFGQSFNLTANLTRLTDQGHLLVTPVIMNEIENHVSTHAPGTTRFLLQLVDDITNTFSDLNNQMDRYLLQDVTTIN